MQSVLAERGGGIHAVCVDGVERNREVHREEQLVFPILSDADLGLVRELGLLHGAGGPDGQDIAIPAQFLVAPDGEVLWSHIAGKITDRVDPAETLRAVQRSFAD